MFGQSNLQEEILKTYVDKVFDKYDTDKSGTLDQNEMTIFFNELFKSLGINKQVSAQESLEAIKTIDKNFDGGVSKEELFIAFKAMLNKSQQPVQPPPQYYGQPMYPPQYGGYGGYGGSGYYPPPQPGPYPGYGNYPPPQGYGYYPQSPYYPQQPPMQPQNQMYSNQGQPMYNSNSSPSNGQNMMYSYSQPSSQNQGNQGNPNPYLSNSMNPYGKK